MRSVSRDGTHRSRRWPDGRLPRRRRAAAAAGGGGAWRCIARWGVAKTTLDDIAREAGVSRATVYRTLPGGKDRLLAVVLDHEVGRFFHEVDAEPRRRRPTSRTCSSPASAGAAASCSPTTRPCAPARATSPRWSCPTSPSTGSTACWPSPPSCADPTWPASCPTRRSGPPPSGAPARPHLQLHPAGRCDPHDRDVGPPGSSAPTCIPALRPPLPGAVMSTNEEIIGRADVNDLEAILAVTQHRPRRGRPRRRGQRRRHLHVGLREGRRARRSTSSTRRPRRSQWNGETDLPWDTDVDQEAVVINNAMPTWAAWPAGGDIDARPARRFAKFGRAGVDPARHRDRRTGC